MLPTLDGPNMLNKLAICKTPIPPSPFNRSLPLNIIYRALSGESCQVLLAASVTMLLAAAANSTCGRMENYPCYVTRTTSKHRRKQSYGERG